MNENGVEKERVLGMLTEINQLLEQLDKTIESSFKTLRSDLYVNECKRMESVERLISNGENRQVSLLTNKSDDKTSALKLELGF